MKIGVAFCGSGGSSAAAHVFMDALVEHAMTIDMLSVTSLAGLPALLWANGLDREQVSAFMEVFCAEQEPQKQLDMLDQIDWTAPKRLDLAVSCVDAASGSTIIYSDTLKSDAWNLKALPLTGNELEAVKRSISPYTNLAAPKSGEAQYCDFSVRYGCPFFPLKMAGLDRLLSVTFAGGKDPAHAAADSLAALTSRNASLHYEIRVDDTALAPEVVRKFVDENIADMYQYLLF